MPVNVRGEQVNGKRLSVCSILILQVLISIVFTQIHLKEHFTKNVNTVRDIVTEMIFKHRHVEIVLPCLLQQTRCFFTSNLCTLWMTASLN